MAKKTQPARTSYFFGKGYRDLWHTIKAAFRRNMDSAHDYWEQHTANDEHGVSSLIAIACCVTLYVFGTLWTLFFSLLHVIVLGLFFLLVYLGFAIVKIVDSIYILVKHISAACPNQECQAHFRLPSYVCECGRVHSDLTPGKYGILQRKCLCGRKLPTTFFNGREKITSICPECGTPLKGIVSRQLSIPIIGSKSSGKTCYVNMAVTLFKDQIAPERGWTFEFYDESDSILYERAFYRLGSGDAPESTSDHQLTAYKFLLSSPKWSVPKQIFIYDVAGEIFSNSFEVSSQRAYGYSNGFLILIDPFSLPEFTSNFAKEDVAPACAVQADLNDMLDVLLVNLERMFNLKNKEMLKTSVAVVINKIDMGDLEELIGATAVERYMAEHPDVKTVEDARNAVCEGFLSEYGAGNFVRTLKAKVNRLQYFTCSVLGHEPDGTMFEPMGAEDPILWLLHNADSSIK